MAISERGRQSGGVTLEVLLEFLLVLIIVPPLINCAIQAILALANIVLPWVTLVVIVFIVTTALTVIVSARPRTRDFLDASPGGDLPLLPPIDLPRAPRPRREDDHIR